MGFASLLSEISSDKSLVAKVKEQQKRQQVSAKPAVTEKPKPQKPTVKNGTNSQLNGNVYVKSSQSKQQTSNSYINEDPAVRRLKEARRKEREEKEAANPKLQQKSKKRQAASGSSSTTRKSPSAPRSRSPALRPKFKSQSPIPPKKVTTGPNLSFKDLMKQADSIDTSKMALKAVKKSTSFSDNKQPLSKALQSIKRAEMSVRESGSKKFDTRTNDRHLEIVTQKVKSVPTFAKPSSELLKRLQNKKNTKEDKPKFRKTLRSIRQKRDEFGIDAEDDDEDDDEYGYYSDDYGDEDGFIVDDEEDNGYSSKSHGRLTNKGYNREEIWNMFGKGSNVQKRQYYNDYDEDDDMEATGAEIFEEEERALKQAKLDDKREQQLLERRAAEKRKSLKRK